MSGPNVAPVPVNGVFRSPDAVGMQAANNALNDSQVNSFRISTVIDRLSLHLCGSVIEDTFEFFNLCLSLSRGIDYAITNGDVPVRVPDLPPLLRQVCLRKKDAYPTASVLVLMISVKNACKRGWFSEGDSKELMGLAAEVAKLFDSVCDFNVELRCSDSVISTVMSRFYPRIKMNHMLAYREVKPGYDAYLIDFFIGKDIKFPNGSTINVFVVQTDNIETSSCLITPPKVNFFVNGIGVERRTNIFLDSGPQIPTALTQFLRYGSNVLQAVGEFTGNYIIVVGVMTAASNPCSNCLKDYELPAPAFVDSDSEIIEGPSRVSINCPISFKRIQTPVKGCLCKHFQCFDYDNYVDINSRRPSWRCPHCNQSVCFTDIRVDQKMFQILKEVETRASEIIVSSDGSWTAVSKIDESIRDPENKISDKGDDGKKQPMTGVLDLTAGDDDALDCRDDFECGDQKAPLQMPSIQEPPSNLDDAFWSALCLSTLGQVPLSPPPSDDHHQIARSSLAETEPLSSRLPPAPDALVDAAASHASENPLWNLNDFGRPASVLGHMSRVHPMAVPTASVLQKRRRIHYSHPVALQASVSGANSSYQGSWATSTSLPHQQQHPVIQQSGGPPSFGHNTQSTNTTYGAPRSSQQSMTTTPFHHQQAHAGGMASASSISRAMSYNAGSAFPPSSAGESQRGGPITMLEVRRMMMTQGGGLSREAYLDLLKNHQSPSQQPVRPPARPFPPSFMARPPSGSSSAATGYDRPSGFN